MLTDEDNGCPGAFSDNGIYKAFRAQPFRQMQLGHFIFILAEGPLAGAALARSANGQTRS